MLHGYRSSWNTSIALAQTGMPVSVALCVQLPGWLLRCTLGPRLLLLRGLANGRGRAQYPPGVRPCPGLHSCQEWCLQPANTGRPQSASPPLRMRSAALESAHSTHAVSDGLLQVGLKTS